MNKNKDIFEELKTRCGCSNISDLRTKYVRGAALHFLEKESFTRNFPAKSVAEAKEYVEQEDW